MNSTLFRCRESDVDPICIFNHFSSTSNQRLSVVWDNVVSKFKRRHPPAGLHFQWLLKHAFTFLPSSNPSCEPHHKKTKHRCAAISSISSFMICQKKQELICVSSYMLTIYIFCRPKKGAFKNICPGAGFRNFTMLCPNTSKNCQDL